MSFSISGNAGIGRANVFYSGTSSGSVSADIFGAYTITGLSNGNYTITPSLVSYRFFPASQNVTISGSNVTGVNFTASNTLNIFRIRPLYGPETFCDPGLSNSPDCVANFPCRLISITADNSANSSDSFVKAYNIGTPIVGTTPPQIVLRVRTGNIVTQEFHTGNTSGIVFLTALSIAATNLGGIGGTGQPFPISVSVKFSGD